MNILKNWCNKRFAVPAADAIRKRFHKKQQINNNTLAFVL